MNLVDANVLLYAVNSDARRHEESRRWLDSALSGNATVAFAWIALLAFVSGLLIIDLFVPARDKHVTFWLAIASLLGCAVLAGATAGDVSVVTFQGMCVSDPMPQVLKVAVLIASVAVATAMAVAGKVGEEEEGRAVSLAPPSPLLPPPPPPPPPASG